MTGRDAFWADPKAISTLVDETRAVREALHALVQRTRVRRDRMLGFLRQRDPQAGSACGDRQPVIAVDLEVLAAEGPVP